jgi:hypothetical protein
MVSMVVMRISWNTLGIVIKASTVIWWLGIGLLALGVVVNSPGLLVAGFVALGLLFPTGFACAACALLYFAGLLKITCPWCGEASRLVAAGKYTYLHCPKCGDVHAQGFFCSKYSNTYKETRLLKRFPWKRRRYHGS